MALIVAALITAAVTPLVARVAVRLGVVDRPGALKVHDRPVPYLGGVAVLLGLSGPVLLAEPALLVPLTLALALGLTDDVADPASSPEQHALDAVERDELLAAIARLSQEQRLVIELRMAGLKGREIAEELGRSHEAVRMLQHRALDRLGADLIARQQRRGDRHGA